MITAGQGEIDPPDLVDLAESIARGETRAQDAVMQALQRAKSWQNKINAFVALDDARALERAAEADRQRAAGARLAPLHGVPIAIKDMFDADGLEPGCGAGPPRVGEAIRDAAVVEALARAGAIIIGRLHMTEYALGLTGHNDHIGDCCNPWALDRITGGSSSGPAAAVAARIVPAAIGSDTGASIRIPAAWCGVAGLKPTHGLVDPRGAMPMSLSLDTIGPIATTMRGAARLLASIAALPSAPPHPACRNGRLDGLRIGLVQDYFSDNLDTAVETALGAVVSTLRDLGATIAPAPAAQADLARRLHRLTMTAEAAAIHDRRLRSAPQGFTAEVRYRLELGRRLPATAYLAATRGRARLLRAYLAEAFVGCDVLLTALVPRPAPERNRTRFGAPGFAAELLADIPKRTQPFNYLGLPALAMPCGFAQDLPIGCQLVGRPFDDRTLLAIGMAYENATDWHRRAPRWPGE
jgi:aspartyl-tRNA(Asn)/glutamyl-tRNA(Gln) amidotransferase subunit A